MMRGEELYERVKLLEKNWLEGTVQNRITKSISSSLLLAQSSTEIQDQLNERMAAGEKFLAVLKEAWEDHQLCMGMINDVLMYMVSSYGYIYDRVILTCANRTVLSQSITPSRPSMSSPWRSSETMYSELPFDLIPPQQFQTSLSLQFFL